MKKCHTQVLLEDALLEVTYVYYPPVKGMRDSLGVPEEPDSPADVEIYKISTKDGLGGLLDEDQIETIKDEIIKQHIR